MDDPLDIFFGEANNAVARVFARWSAENVPPGCRLTGNVVGPSCVYSHTLSATIPLRGKPPADPRQTAGAALLAEAIVPDPCFWTVELPFLYLVQVELRRGDEVLASAERSLGIRRLGAHQRRLLFDGRGWVARGVDVREVPERPPADWRAADLAMVVERPDQELCAEASRLGVLLIAELTGEAAMLSADVRQLARWPAVAIAVLPAGVVYDRSIRHAATNLLLGEKRVQGSARVQNSWVDVLVCESDSAEGIVEAVADSTLPVLAWRTTGWRDTLSDARQACDLLQRDLAGAGEFAGFLV